MKIGHIEIFVKDCKTSKDFYCNVLGFEHVADQGVNQWVKLGDIEILLRQGNYNQNIATYQDSSHGLVIYTSNLEKTAEKLRKNGLEFKGTDGNENCLTFTDIDGHWFQLVNPEHS